MLQRLANLTFGVLILGLAGSMLLLHITSDDPLQMPVLLFGSGLLIVAAACFRVGLRAGEEEALPTSGAPSAGDEAAKRLRELKRAGASRYRGLRGLSGLETWKV